MWHALAATKNNIVVFELETVCVLFKGIKHAKESWRHSHTAHLCGVYIERAKLERWLVGFGHVTNLLCQCPWNFRAKRFMPAILIKRDWNTCLLMQRTETTVTGLEEVELTKLVNLGMLYTNSVRRIYYFLFNLSCDSRASKSRLPVHTRLRNLILVREYKLQLISRERGQVPELCINVRIFKTFRFSQFSMIAKIWYIYIFLFCVLYLFKCEIIHAAMKLALITLPFNHTVFLARQVSSDHLFIRLTGCSTCSHETQEDVVALRPFSQALPCWRALQTQFLLVHACYTSPHVSLCLFQVACFCWVLPSSGSLFHVV